MLILLGYGTTNQAIAEKFAPCLIFDDTFLQESKDSFGNSLLPSSKLSIMLKKHPKAKIITSPGIPPNNPMILEVLEFIKQHKEAQLLSEYDFFAKDMPCNIWISGTNGKTTTTQILTHLLKSFGAISGGNIGTPLAKLNKTAKIWVLETSSFTLHYTKIATPNLYLLLPLSQDHIGWHGSYENYIADKLKIILKMRDKEIAILPKSLESHPFCKNTLAKLIFYTDSKDLENIFNLDSNAVHFKEPFLLDALLSLSITEILFSKQDYALLNTFKIGAHKIEEFYDSLGRLWIDDSKGTNLDATIQALRSYKDKEILLILGGDDKGADLTPLFEVIATQNIKIFAIGSNTDKLQTLANTYKIPILPCHTLQKAVLAIKQDFIDSTQIAMLSPAAASLDQFSSYKDRGEQFKNFALS